MVDNIQIQLLTDANKFVCYWQQVAAANEKKLSSHLQPLVATCSHKILGCKWLLASKFMYVSYSAPSICLAEPCCQIKSSFFQKNVADLLDRKLLVDEATEL